VSDDAGEAVEQSGSSPGQPATRSVYGPGSKRDLESGRSGSFSEGEDAWDDDNYSLSEGRYPKARTGPIFALEDEDEDAGGTSGPMERT
jgi:hypothetical protein